MDLLLDIDSVLRNFLGSTYKTLKIHYPKKVPKCEPIVTEWDFTKFYPNFEKKELLNLVFEKYVNEIYFDNAETIDWVIETIPKIKRVMLNGEKIFLRTHQPKLAMIPTLKFVLKHNLFFDGIFMTKENVPKNIIKNSILIDDKPENIFDHGIETSVMITRPWNEKINNPNLNRAKTSDELFQNVLKILNKNDIK